ncbi:MAG: sulfite exporter TauE/SafE family protein [Gammaproteobacteria bacterium]|nr:sulfite exporter TauE/SafE family protein [Gammaproteobacteria bacterium]
MRGQPIDTLTIGSAALILFTAYFIRGISGFGSGLVAIPLLAHFLPLQFVVPWVLVLDFSASLALGIRRQDRRAIRWDEIGWLLPTTLVGLLLGIFLLVNLPKPPLLIGLGLFVMAFGIRSLLYLHGDRSISRWWSLPAGITGGTVGGMFGTGGPPYVIYLSHRIHDKLQLRATFSGLFFIDGGLRVIIFTLTGLLSQDAMLLACLLGLGVMAFGLYAGHRVHLGITQAQMTRIIGALLLGSGLSLLVKAFAG